MSIESKPASFLQRLRYRWYRFAFWWFLVLGSIGVISGLFGTILSIVGDKTEEFGPWWAQAMVVAFGGIFAAVGVKGLKIRSVAALEADHAEGQERIGRFLARLIGSPKKGR